MAGSALEGLTRRAEPPRIDGWGAGGHIVEPDGRGRPGRPPRRLRRRGSRS